MHPEFILDLNLSSNTSNMPWAYSSFSSKFLVFISDPFLWSSIFESSPVAPLLCWFFNVCANNFSKSFVLAPLCFLVPQLDQIFTQNSLIFCVVVNSCFFFDIYVGILLLLLLNVQRKLAVAAVVAAAVAAAGTKEKDKARRVCFVFLRKWRWTLGCSWVRFKPEPLEICPSFRVLV